MNIHLCQGGSKRAIKAMGPSSVRVLAFASFQVILSKEKLRKSTLVIYPLAPTFAAKAPITLQDEVTC